MENKSFRKRFPKNNSKMRKIQIYPKSKKAQMFSLLAILIIFLLFVSFEIYSYIHQRQAIRTRVASMDSFLNSVEKNLERQMYISGFRIIFLAISDISSNGNYIDVDNFFNESFFNGTVSGVYNSIMDGATYSNITNSINAKAAKINVNVTMINPQIKVTQMDPWNVEFTLITNFSMNDVENLASWHKQQNISALISVESFQDPLFIVNKENFPKLINKSIYSSISGLSNLSSHVNSKSYFANPNAPSFLNRLEGNLSANVNGIERFVIRTDLPSEKIYDKSVVDYVYFSSNNPSSSIVNGMPSWFKIDDAHRTFYNISI